MEITNIEFKVIYRNAENLKAIVSITLNDSFIVNGIKLYKYNNENKLFTQFPLAKINDKFECVAKPSNEETWNKIEKSIIDKYNEYLEKIKELEF
jgi:DNA-binding cell septation regulator SpoVG